jgi:hypothetical protein
MICTACGTSGLKGISSLKSHECKATSDWVRVTLLREKGEDQAAERLARKLLGIKGEPMTPEAKEKLRVYKEEHAEEIKARVELKRATRKRLELLVMPAKSLRRKA